MSVGAFARPTQAENSALPKAVLIGERRISGILERTAWVKVTFVPATDEMTSGLSAAVEGSLLALAPMEMSPYGKRMARMSSEISPHGVKEIRPVWSVLMVAIGPATEDGTSCVVLSSSAVMPSASKNVWPP